MKANELRIGNYVISPFGAICQVRCIDFADEEIDTLFLPIPLTEEWLLKFGFRFDSIDWEFPKDSMFFIGWYAGRFCLGSGSDGVTKETYIEYVHQLQNLYFALTNEELTQKD